MRYRLNEDLFYHKQPELAFLEDLLRPVHHETPAVWNARAARADEVVLKAVNIRAAFPDPDGLLETAFADFSLF